MYSQRQVLAVLYDNFQLHSIATDLIKIGIRMRAFPQTARRVESDQGLYDAIIGRNIHHFNHSELNDHIINAVAIETGRRFRLAKEKSSKKIDAAVALSMALHGARDHPQGNIGQLLRAQYLKRSKRKEVDTETLMKRLGKRLVKELRDF